jgi:hypothetical protein
MEIMGLSEPGNEKARTAPRLLPLIESMQSAGWTWVLATHQRSRGRARL